MPLPFIDAGEGNPTTFHFLQQELEELELSRGH